MSRRWLRAGHAVVGYARTAETVEGLVADGAISVGATSLEDLVARLPAPRTVWLMVPAASVDATLDQLVPLLSAGDTVVDGLEQREVDAETSPLRDPELYQYRLDLLAITEVWRRGSVIASWLLDLTAQAFDQSPDLADFEGRVSDSGEGRWTSIAAVDVSAPAPVLTAALYARFSSRGEDDFADKVLSAMRFGFGGHLETGK